MQHSFVQYMPNMTLPSTKYTVKEPFWKRVVDVLLITGREHYELDNELLNPVQKMQ